MHDFWDWLIGLKGSAAVAGAVGGLVRQLRLGFKLADALVSVIVGAACATYLSDLAEPLVTVAIGQVVIDEGRRIAMSGFLVGLGGWSITGLIIDYWNWRKKKGIEQ